MIPRRFFLLLLTAITLLGASRADADPHPQDGQRIVFLGDSITHGGTYIVYLETYLLSRFPSKDFNLINLGLSSETTSGRSEPVHPFPRPCIHDRLDRALAESKPNYLVACYGMNDGIYHPPSPQGMTDYQNGVNQLIEKAQNAGAQTILLMTPPIFDPTHKTTCVPITAPLFGYKTPYQNYNEVLSEYAAWIRDQHTRFPIAAIHQPMIDLLQTRRQQQPDFVLAKDGVHPGATGHLVMAMGILDAWEASPIVDSATINADSLTTPSVRVNALIRASDGIGFAWRTRIPMPMDPTWDTASLDHLNFLNRFNNHQLIVTGLNPTTSYTLFEGPTPIAQATGAQFAQGLNLAAYPNLSTNQRSLQLLELVKERQSKLHAAWLKHVGHARAQKSKAPPLEEALQLHDTLHPAIHDLVKPANLKLTLHPTRRP